MYLNEKLPEVETPTKVSDPFSLEALITWLEKQPKKGRYNFACTDGGCLMSLWLNRDYCRVMQAMFEHPDYYTISRKVAEKQPHNFGAALARAKSLLKE